MGEKGQRTWLGFNLFLLLAVASGLVLLLLNLPASPPVRLELNTPAPPGVKGVYIGGAVAAPGIYPYRPGDTVEDLLEAAGGPLPEAAPDRLKLYVPFSKETPHTQKVNINTAPVWLLDALPGVGEKLARAIVDYREEHGPFRSTEELTHVPGIGPGLYQRIKDLITVED